MASILSGGFVVTPNYFDRSDNKNRWLVRQENDPPEKAIAYKRVRLHNVEFRPAGDFEIGFGCGTVALAQDVMILEEDSTKEPNRRVLNFDGLEFRDTETSEIVERAHIVDLGSDGSVTAPDDGQPHLILVRVEFGGRDAPETYADLLRNMGVKIVNESSKEDLKPPFASGIVTEELN